MSDIELVIKIPEEIYSRILKRNRIHTFDNETICDAIKNGTPLPKGHGKLIDADKLANEIYVIDSYSEDAVIEQIKDALAVIEVDKGESEG